MVTLFAKPNKIQKEIETITNFNNAVWYGKANGFYFFDFLNDNKQWEKRFADTQANLELIAQKLGKELAFNYEEV